MLPASYLWNSLNRASGIQGANDSDGPDFYKRFLRVVPAQRALADWVMTVSRMEPVALEEFLFDMVEAPETATQTLTNAIEIDG